MNDAADTFEALKQRARAGDAEALQALRDGGFFAERRAGRADLPVSAAQRRLWILDRLRPGLPVYNMPEALRLDGPLDVGALRSALNALVERQESLRTTFAEIDGEPRQVIGPASAFALREADVSGAPSTGAAARALAEAEATAPFDLASVPLFRATLVRMVDAGAPRAPRVRPRPRRARAQRAAGPRGRSRVPRAGSGARRAGHRGCDPQAARRRPREPRRRGGARSLARGARRPGRARRGGSRPTMRTPSRLENVPSRARRRRRSRACCRDRSPRKRATWARVKPRKPRATSARMGKSSSARAIASGSSPTNNPCAKTHEDATAPLRGGAARCRPWLDATLRRVALGVALEADAGRLGHPGRRARGVGGRLRVPRAFPGEAGRPR